MDKTLAKHIQNGIVIPSYLLIDRDIEKLRHIADWFAEGFNKADIFRLEGNPNIQVKETEAFILRTHLAAIGTRKLFIVCDVAAMTPAAQNKILKTIEDTTADTFLLLASNFDNVLNTIKSRCVIVYPDPSPPAALPEKILEYASKVLFDCKTLDDALPYISFLTQKDNFQNTLFAFNRLLYKKLQTALDETQSSRFTISKTNDILKRLAIINRNIAANCNPQNAFDSLLIEIFSKQ